MKKILWVIIALSLFTIAWQVGDFIALQTAGAETVPQMRIRLFEEARLRHPDVWNCDAAHPNCVADRVAQAPLVFAGMAKQSNSIIADVARYSLVRDYEWGQSFEKDFKRPPTMFDWGLSYVGRMATVQKELDFAPQLFVNVDNEKNTYRFKRLEYAE